MVTAFLTTFLSMPLWRRWSYRTGFVDDPGHRKIHEQPIALAGGLAVLAGLLAPLLGGLAIASSIPAVSDARTAAHVGLSRSLGDYTLGLLSYGFARRG